MRQLWWFIILGFTVLVTLTMSCFTDVDNLNTPDGLPPILISENSPYSYPKSALGRRLFFDKNISIDSTITCANCHLPEYAYSDTTRFSNGVNNGTTDRNSPSLIYAGFSPLINKDGGVVKLDLQALIPIEDHNEMGIHILSLAERLQADQLYNQTFIDAFDREPDAFTIPRALAHFIRTLPTASSSYDKFVAGDEDAMTDTEKKGMDLFISDRLQCASCHSPPLFSTFEFANNGIYDSYEDLGRALISQDSTDIGKFRIASLRNISLTGPYMHDGSMETLEEVIQHYASGGSQHVNKDDRIHGFDISQEETEELLAFFSALTDMEPK